MLAATAFLAGLAVVGATLLSALRTIVLPRAARSLLTAGVFRGTARVFRVVAGPGRSYQWRDRVYALYAPISLVLMAVAWVVAVWLGFIGMFWATGYGTLRDSLWVSGSSLLTLGIAPLDGTFHRLLGFTEALFGLGLVALLISFLPSLYSAFSRREQLVALLEVRAGSPPSAVEMLIRFHRIGWRESLSSEWERWEAWFNDLDESHTSYPALVWLRSPQSHRSWVTAAGTVLDAAALWLSSVDHRRDPTAALCLRSGYLALRRVAGYFGIAFDPDPRPTDPVAVTRGEFEEALEALAEAGLAVHADHDQAWRDFAGWRVNYDAVLLTLAELTIAPYAPWTSDRSGPGHRRPRLTRWWNRP